LWPASTAISVFLSLALVRLVAPDRAHVSDAVLALLAFAAAGRVTLAAVPKISDAGVANPDGPAMIP
jgi:hypothetical protein